MATFRKRGERWQAQVRRKGVFKSETFGTKQAAQIWARGVEAEIDAGTSGIIQNRPFVDALRRYSAEVTPGKRGGRWETIRLYAIERDPIASVTMPKLTGSDVAEWRDRRLKTVSGSTVNREWNLLSNVCSVAINEWHWLAVNPFSSVRRPKESPPRNRLPTTDEIERLRIASGYHDGKLELVEQRVFAAFLFAIETGMRSGEICALDDVRGSVAHLPVTKNGTAREVPLSAEAVRIWKQVGRFDLTDSQRDAVWRKVKAKAGVVGLTFHDARAEAITRLSKKLDILQLARMVGHKDLSMLQRYYRESAADIAKKL